MNKIQLIKDKYLCAVHFIDLTPNDHIAEVIKEISDDISKLKFISFNYKDNKDIVSASEKLQSTLTYQLEYFTSKQKDSVDNSSGLCSLFFLKFV
jgi:hypothetical protein